MHIAICDDEVNQIEHIKSLLAEYRSQHLPSMSWTAFRTGFSLLSAMEQGKHFDAVLLDIYMTDMNGMEAAKSIRAFDESVNLLFLTSSPDFAVESYQVEARDYILKPITRARLFRSLEKLQREMERAEGQGAIVRDAAGGMVRVFWNRLMYFEVMGHYCILYLADGTSVRTVSSFSALWEQLKECPEFIQCHRSYGVNLKYIHRIEKNEAILLNGASVPIARNRRQEITDSFIRMSFDDEV